MEPIAYLAMEIKQRELESRVMIAAHLLKAGVAVFLGQQWGLFGNAKALPPGVVLFKTVNQIQARSMEKCRANGHLVAATDEEVLVCTDDKCFLEVFSPLASENCDLFFAQSDFHREVVERRFPSLRGRTQTVGNARVDFLSLQRREAFGPEVQNLTSTYGPYILFNANYAQLNSIWENSKHLLNIAADVGMLNVDDPASVEEYKAKWNWERQNRDEMVRLIRWAVDELPDRQIVIRPHPGEVPNFWTDRFSDCERVHIIPRSNPHPWILGADMVVHTTCTTGLEAALMDKPVVNLVPVSHPTFDFITNHVNPSFSTWQSAAAAMSRYFASGDGPVIEGKEKRASVLNNHFAMDEKGATAKIADGLIALLQDYGVSLPISEITQFRHGGYKSFSRTGVVKEKFQLEDDELITRLQSALNSIGAYINVKVQKIDDSLFLLRP